MKDFLKFHFKKMEPLEVIDFSSCLHHQPDEFKFELFKPKPTDNLIDRLTSEMSESVTIEVSKIGPENQLRIEYDNVKKKYVIDGTYVTDMNILYIDEYITNYLSDTSEKLKRSQVKYLLTKDRLESEQMTVNELRQCQKQLAKLDQEIEDLKQNKFLSEYKLEVSEILREYERIGVKRTPISFISSEDSLDSSKGPDVRRRLVKLYLEIVRNYHDINVVFVHKTEEKCGHCQGSEFFTNSDLMKECLKCSYITNIFSTEDENLINKKYYSNTSNDIEKTIQKKLDKIQGKSDIGLPEDIFELLDEYFYKIGFPLGTEIRTWDIDSDGMRFNSKESQRTNVAMLREALSEIGYPKYYDEAYLIAHEYWGWELHDLSNLEELIKLTYINTISFIQSFKGDRSSDCNSEYWFYRVLEQTYQSLSPIYFNIIKTEKTLNYHENLWSEVCKSFGWIPPKSL